MKKEMKKSLKEIICIGIPFIYLYFVSLEGKIFVTSVFEVVWALIKALNTVLKQLTGVSLLITVVEPYITCLIVGAILSTIIGIDRKLRRKIAKILNHIVSKIVTNLLLFIS